MQYVWCVLYVLLSLDLAHVDLYSSSIYILPTRASYSTWKTSLFRTTRQEPCAVQSSVEMWCMLLSINEDTIAKETELLFTRALNHLLPAPTTANSPL